MSNPYTEFWASVSNEPTGSATSLVPVFAAIRCIVDFISTLPVDFYRRNPDGSRTQVGPPELIRNAEDEFGLETWFGQIAHSLVTRGNAVGDIKAVGQSGPTRIKWESDWTADEGQDAPWWVNGKSLPNKKVAHIPWLVPAGKRLGLSPIRALRVDGAGWARGAGVRECGPGGRVAPVASEEHPVVGDAG